VQITVHPDGVIVECLKNLPLEGDAEVTENLLTNLVGYAMLLGYAMRQKTNYADSSSFKCFEKGFFCQVFGEGQFCDENTFLRLSNKGNVFAVLRIQHRVPRFWRANDGWLRRRQKRRVYRVT